MCIPLVNDVFNEAIEGFFVMVVSEGISNQTVNLVREGLTLVRIEDDDGELLIQQKFNGIHYFLC